MTALAAKLKMLRRSISQLDVTSCIVMKKTSAKINPVKLPTFSFGKKKKDEEEKRKVSKEASSEQPLEHKQEVTETKLPFKESDTLPERSVELEDSVEVENFQTASGSFDAKKGKTNILDSIRTTFKKGIKKIKNTFQNQPKTNLHVTGMTGGSCDSLSSIGTSHSGGDIIVNIYSDRGSDRFSQSVDGLPRNVTINLDFSTNQHCSLVKS